MDEIQSCELFLHVCRLNPYSTACGLAALDVFICSPAAVSADLAALVIAGSHYVLTLEAAAQLAADFALPVRTPPEFDGA